MNDPVEDEAPGATQEAPRSRSALSLAPSARSAGGAGARSMTKLCRRAPCSASRSLPRKVTPGDGHVGGIF